MRVTPCGPSSASSSAARIPSPPSPSSTRDAAGAQLDSIRPAPAPSSSTPPCPPSEPTLTPNAADVSLPAMSSPSSPQSMRPKDTTALTLRTTAPPQSLYVSAFLLGGMGVLLSVFTWLLANVVPPAQGDAQARAEHAQRRVEGAVKRARRSSAPVTPSHMHTRPRKRTTAPPAPIMVPPQSPQDRHVVFVDGPETPTPTARREPSPRSSLSDSSTLVNHINLTLEEGEADQQTPTDSKSAKSPASRFKFPTPSYCKAPEARSSSSSLESGKPVPAHLKRSSYLSSISPRLSRFGKKVKRASTGSAQSSIASSDSDNDPLKPLRRTSIKLPAPGWSRAFGWPTSTSPVAVSAPSTPAGDGRQTFFGPGSATPSRNSSLTRGRRTQVGEMSSNRAASSYIPSPMSETFPSVPSSSRPAPTRSSSVCACHFRKRAQEDTEKADKPSEVKTEKVAKDASKPRKESKLGKCCKIKERRRQSAPVPVPRTQPYAYPYFAAPPVVKERRPVTAVPARSESLTPLAKASSPATPKASVPPARSETLPGMSKTASGPPRAIATTTATRKRTLSSPTKPDLAALVEAPAGHRVQRPSTADGTNMAEFGVLPAREAATTTGSRPCALRLPSLRAWAMGPVATAST
ncbi:uncharacterized protein SCHCODRAFT_02675340 [Schizophyllum commune H4-8]|uniref:Uncharacterized protein n=1 Tax=Schizophyllum commune (strain H4-8 / FGSC 9210) TaxID=578458 RepID=D8PSG3_SCHCM|nr:uncharacterized protein SCHCODRAFT_02675340 [Schizophyllum commune H4-8]KAI5897776.1 hypothetical protein SCHCODRAFT_02675340 [Schizophyllum commune H4-8]